MTHTSSFTGSIPEHYDHYLGPMFFEPYAVDIAKRIDPSRVNTALEIGCGTGRVTRHLRQALASNATLVASDISPDMLAMAKKHLNGLNIEWRIIDAQQLPFGDQSLDLVVCCFAYMFVENKEKAFSEVFRVLKPGGMFLFSTWDKLEYNEASFIFRNIVKEYLTDPLPVTYKLPFAYNDPEEIKDLVERTGFKDLKIEHVEKVTVSTAREASIGLARGGSLYNEIMSRNPVWIDEISEKLEQELVEKFGSDPMYSRIRAVVCEAYR
jgi:ubiquinone/menaquinone biosynthesis C-methylase UbiE